MIFDRFGLMARPYNMRLRNGLTIELRPGGSGDRYAFYEVLVRQDYTSSGQRLKPADTVIDVGANIGCFTLLAARAVGASGRVIALEPEKHTFRQLQRNIELSEMSNITALRVALGADECTVNLHYNGRALFSSLYNTIDGHSIQGDVQEVRMTTLEALMAKEGVERCHYLKLDCEGAEYDIVGSLSLEVAECIEQITMEIHEVPGADLDALKFKLSQLGFTPVGRGRLAYYLR